MRGTSRSIETHQFSWLFTKINENQWKSLKINENHVFSWKLMIFMIGLDSGRAVVNMSAVRISLGEVLTKKSLYSMDFCRFFIEKSCFLEGFRVWWPQIFIRSLFHTYSMNLGCFTNLQKFIFFSDRIFVVVIFWFSFGNHSKSTYHKS